MRNVLTVIMVIMLTATGCTNYNVEEVLLQNTEISLTWKGDLQISYAPNTHQLGYNESRNEYRVYDDKLANWFVLKCDQVPATVGQIINCDISWTGKSNIKNMKGVELKVEKTDDMGRIWLWNQDNGIGIIIKSR